MCVRMKLLSTEIYSGVMCYGAVIVCLMMYALPFDAPWAYEARLIGIAVLVLLAIARVLYMLWKMDYRQLNMRMAVFPLALLMGLIVLGNLFVSNPLGHGFAKGIALVAGPIEEKTLPLVKGEKIVAEGGDFSIGDHREQREYDEYCKDMVHFVNYYGMILLMVLAVHWLFLEGKKKGMLIAKDRVLFEIFLVVVVGLPLFLFFTDFVQFGSRAWFKTRFMEIPVYLIIFVFLYFADRVTVGRLKKFIMIALLMYAIIPFIATQRPQQIKFNYENFVK